MVRQAELGPAKAAGRHRFEDGDGLVLEIGRLK